MRVLVAYAWRVSSTSRSPGELPEVEISVFIPPQHVCVVFAGVGAQPNHPYIQGSSPRRAGCAERPKEGAVETLLRITSFSGTTIFAAACCCHGVDRWHLGNLGLYHDHIAWSEHMGRGMLHNGVDWSVCFHRTSAVYVLKIIPWSGRRSIHMD